MSEDEIGRLIYLVLLGAVVGGYFLLNNRRQLGKMTQQAAIWGLIFVGAIAGFGLWSDIRTDVAPRQQVFDDGGRIEVPRAIDGHYYLTLKINDAPIRFVVDTGATDVVLNQADAQSIGLNLDSLRYLGRAGTANGEVRTARVRLDRVELGPIVDRNLGASVNEGELDTSLLGMTYLQRFERLEFAQGKLILTR